MNCGFMIKIIYEYYLVLLWILICMICYLCKSLRIFGLVWPTRSIFLTIGEVLSFGFNLVVSFPSDSRGSKARIVLFPSRIKRWGLYQLLEFIPLHHVILLNALLRSYELNTLDACWIASDVWIYNQDYLWTLFGSSLNSYMHDLLTLQVSSNYWLSLAY